MTCGFSTVQVSFSDLAMTLVQHDIQLIKNCPTYSRMLFSKQVEEEIEGNQLT